MLTRLSPAVLAALIVLAGLTVWITRQAKTLEQDLDSSSQKIALLDKPAPDFHSTSLDGRPVSLSDYHGRKKLVLVFWASWNNASGPEMMMLQDLYRNNHQPDSDFEMLGVSLDDSRAAAESYVKDTKLLFPVLYDEGRTLSNAFEIRTVPTLLLVDTDGKVSYGTAGLNQRGQVDFAQRLGLKGGEMRFEMRGPNGRRGN